MLKRTPLFDLHHAAGARLVDFGGWEMPLHYGSQLEEHQAVRTHCGVFDVSHMRVLDLTGPGSLPFLRTLLANDAGRLLPGQALYSCMLQDDGGVVDDLIVYRRAPADAYRLVVNAATAARDLAWMQRQQALFAALAAPGGATAFALQPQENLALIAVQGPGAARCLAQALPALAAPAQALAPFYAVEVGEVFVARTGYTGEDGFELALPAAQAAQTWRALVDAQAAPCGLGARDTLRLEAGMNLYGSDMDETVSPLESGLGWTVDLRSARAFIGREVLEQQRRDPDLRQLLGLKLLGRGVLRSHQAVDTAFGPGQITSGSVGPTVGTSIALARLPAGVGAGDEVSVQLRSGPAPALVVRPPFVRRGKVLV